MSESAAHERDRERDREGALGDAAHKQATNSSYPGYTLPLCRFATLPLCHFAALPLCRFATNHKKRSGVVGSCSSASPPVLHNHQPPAASFPSLAPCCCLALSLPRSCPALPRPLGPSSLLLIVAAVIERVHAMESELSVFTGADAAAFAGGPKTATLRLVVEWDAQRFTQTVSSLDAFDLQDLARRLKARFRS